MAKQLRVKLGLDNSAFRQGLQQSKAEISQLGAAFRNALSFAGGQMIVDGIRKGFRETITEGLNFNDTLQQASLSFKTMLKSAADATKQVREIWDLAKQTPLEFPQLLTASRRMIAFKFSAEDVKDMLVDIGDASAALGLGAEGINRITLALGQMQMKQKVSGEEMRQLAEAGINAWDYLANALGKTVTETQKLSEKGLIPAKEAIQVILLGMREDFGGGMQELSKTYTGLMATLKDSTHEAMGVVMKGQFDNLTNKILPGAIKKVNEFTEGFKKNGLQGGIAAIFPPEDAERIQKIVNDIAAGFQVLLKVGSQVGDTLGGMGRFIADNWETIAPIVMSIVTAWATYKTVITAAAAAQAAMNLAVSANPYILLASAIVGVTGALIGYSRVAAQARQQTIDSAVAKSAEIEQTKNLVSEYYSLRSATDLTSVEKERLKLLEQQLISSLPEAIRLIDSQTLSYAQQQQVLEGLIATKNKDLLESGAMAAKASLPNLEKQLEEMKLQEQKARDYLQGSNKANMEDYLYNDKGVLDFGRAMKEGWTQLQQGFKSAFYESNENLWQDTLSGAIEGRTNLEEQIKNAEAAIKAYDDFVKDSAKGMNQADIERSRYIERKLLQDKQQAEDNLEAARKKSQEDTKAAAEESAKALQEAMKNMSAGANDYFSKLSDGLKSFISDIRSTREELAGFGTMFERNIIEKFSPGKIQSRLNRFLKQIQEWRDGLSDLMNKGVDQDILGNLRQMGLSGAGIVSGLNKMDLQQLANAMGTIGQIRSIATSEATKTVIYRHELDLSGSMDVRGYTSEGELDRIKTIVSQDIADEIGTTVEIPHGGTDKRGVSP